MIRAPPPSAIWSLAAPRQGNRILKIGSYDGRLWPETRISPPPPLPMAAFEKSPPTVAGPIPGIAGSRPALNSSSAGQWREKGRIRDPGKIGPLFRSEAARIRSKPSSSMASPSKVAVFLKLKAPRDRVSVIFSERSLIKTRTSGELFKKMHTLVCAPSCPPRPAPCKPTIRRQNFINCSSPQSARPRKSPAPLPHGGKTRRPPCALR